MQTQSQDALLLFFTSLILFTIGLHSQEIISFEARFYLFAQEMLRHGASWFPTTYQKPYPDYPATSTYLIYGLAKLAGTLNKLIAVLPSAIASAITVAITYLIGALRNRAWGWCAAFFLFFTLTFIVEARTISLDQYVTMVTVACVYLAETLSPHKMKSFLGYTLLLLIFSFAIRGPLGIVIPVGVLSIYFLLDKNYRKFFITACSAAGLLILCCIMLLILAHHAGGDGFVKDVLRMQVASRMQDNTLPLWFYFNESFGGYAITYPLAAAITILSLPSLFKSNASAEIKFLRQCLGWILIIMLGLSIPADKKMRYILPMAPALALMCGYLLAGSYQNKGLIILRRLFVGFCFILPLLGLILTLYLKHKHVMYGLNYIFLLSIFALLQIGIIILTFCSGGAHKQARDVRARDGKEAEYRDVRSRAAYAWTPNRMTEMLGLAALTFYIANVAIVETINLNTNATRDFVLRIESLREKAHTLLVFFQEGSDGLPIKYLVNMNKEEAPIYLYQPQELLQLKPKTLVIVGKENFPHISPAVMKHFHVIMQDKIGHDDVIVIQKN